MPIPIASASAPASEAEGEPIATAPKDTPIAKPSGIL